MPDPPPKPPRPPRPPIKPPRPTPSFGPAFGSSGASFETTGRGDRHLNEAPIDLTVERQLAALRDALDTDRPARAEHLIRDIEAMLSLMARETDPLKLALVKAFRPRLNRAIKRFERIRTTDRSRK